MSSEVLHQLPDGHHVLYVAARGAAIAAITSTPEDELALLWLDGPGAPISQRLPDRGVVAIELDGDGVVWLVVHDALWRAERGEPLRSAGPVASGLIAATERGQIVARPDVGLVLRSRDGAERPLADLGAFPREVELFERSGTAYRVTIDADGAFERGGRRHRTDLPSTLGTTGATAIAAGPSGVALVTVGGVHVAQEARFVDWTGAVTCIVRALDVASTGVLQRRLGSIAPHGTGFAVETSTHRGGSRVSSELWLLDAPDGATAPSRVHRRVALPGGAKLEQLSSDGEHVVSKRKIEGDRSALDLSTGDAWARIADDVTSVNVALGDGGVIYGAGAQIRRAAWATASDAPTPTVAALLAAIGPGGAFEETSVGGRPAVKIVRPDGARQIKPVSAAELADLKRRLERG